MESPLSYRERAEPLDEHDSADLAAFESIVQPFEKEASSSTCDRVERLRHFLLFRLIHDYKVGENASLDAATNRHFCNLGSIADHLARRKSTLSREQRVVFGRYFETRLLGPARALGLPAQLVVTRVQRFALYTVYYADDMAHPIAADGECMVEMLREEGPSALARKLYLDEHHIIPRIVEDQGLRRRLLHVLQQVKAHYFVRLDGVETAVHADGGWGSFRAQFELSAIAQKELELSRSILDIREDERTCVSLGLLGRMMTSLRQLIQAEVLIQWRHGVADGDSSKFAALLGPGEERFDSGPSLESQCAGDRGKCVNDAGGTQASSPRLSLQEKVFDLSLPFWRTKG